MTEDPTRFQTLIDVMARLRAPDGCPWDRAQSLETLKPYLLEETYEVLEAMDGPRISLKEELGDLLLQIVFQSQLAAEEGSFSIADVVESITAKMIHRHPHVFGNTAADTPAEVTRNWEQLKRDERRKKDPRASVLDGIPGALPALLQSWRTTEKASRVGFDWPDVAGVRGKVDEELRELDEAILSGDAAAIGHELGDLLFTVVNLSRKLAQNPEEALRQSLLRFRRRFQHLEQGLHAEGLRPEQLPLEELDRRWELAKRAVDGPEPIR